MPLRVLPAGARGGAALGVVSDPAVDHVLDELAEHDGVGLGRAQLLGHSLELLCVDLLSFGKLGGCAVHGRRTCREDRAGLADEHPRAPILREARCELVKRLVG